MPAVVTAFDGVGELEHVVRGGDGLGRAPGVARGGDVVPAPVLGSAFQRGPATLGVEEQDRVAPPRNRRARYRGLGECLQHRLFGER